MEGVLSDDLRESVARTENDGRREEREAIDVDPAPERRKQGRALSVEEGSPATEGGRSPRETFEPDQKCVEEEHPLQASVTPAGREVLWLELKHGSGN